jgi:3-deoxy-7-phosphoheptulonate synthase
MKTNDARVESFRPLISPAILIEDLPLSDGAAASVTRSRQELVHVLDGRDDRLIVVVGPCSIHDPEAGLEYGQRLRALADELADDLCVVMRVYFEKPRTTVGWKGLINDPRLDGSCRTNDGLRLGRQLLLNLLDLGVPAGCELLDPISPQFISDVLVWGAIGARTTESQVHRQLASGLSVPVGFKNSTDGRVQVAIDALQAAAHPHSFIGVTAQGLASVVTTRGNADTHVILRGGERGTNYDAASVQVALSALKQARLPRRLMIDASHGNSGKDHRRQPVVAREVAEQIAGGEHGIVGVLLESFLVDGRQDLVARDSLVYGQSITDACMGWEMTVPVLRELAAAVGAPPPPRRKVA